MSVSINGTSGVTTPGIANSEGYTGDGLTIAAGAPAGALQIDTSGNAGLGVAPSAWNSINKTIQVGAGGALIGRTDTVSAVNLGANYYYNGTNNIYIGSNYASIYAQINGQHQWFTAPSGTAGNPITFTQAMTLDASGNLLVGTTGVGGNFTISQSGVAWAISNNHANAGTQYFNQFVYKGSQIGSITGNNTSTTYSTSSDYRLKENVAPITNALDTIAALKPCTFTWKADGSADRGFIAHELQEIIPQAVSGEKDAVDAEGNIMPQGVDYGKITPEIVAAIQELKARIEQLEAK